MVRLCEMVGQMKIYVRFLVWLIGAFLIVGCGNRDLGKISTFPNSSGIETSVDDPFDSYIAMCQSAVESLGLAASIRVELGVYEIHSPLRFKQGDRSLLNSTHYFHCDLSRVDGGGEIPTIVVDEHRWALVVQEPSGA